MGAGLKNRPCTSTRLWLALCLFCLLPSAFGFVRDLRNAWGRHQSRDVSAVPRIPPQDANLCKALNNVPVVVRPGKRVRFVMMFKCDPAVGSEIAERGIKSILPAGSSPKSQNERERTGVSRLDFSFDLDREGDVDSFGFYDAETHVLSLKGSATFKDPETVPTFLPMFSQTVSAPLQLMLKDKNKGAGWKAESSQQDLKTVEVGLQVRGASRDTGSDDGGRTRIASPECEVNVAKEIPLSRREPQTEEGDSSQAASFLPFTAKFQCRGLKPWQVDPSRVMPGPVRNDLTPLDLSQCRSSPSMVVHVESTKLKKGETVFEVKGKALQIGEGGEAPKIDDCVIHINWDTSPKAVRQPPLSLVIPFRVPGDGTAQSGGNTTFSSVSPLPPSPPPYPVLGGKTEKTGEKSKPEKEVVTKGDKEGVPVKPHLHLSNNRKSKKQKETSLKDTKEEEKRTGEDKEEDETDYPDILPSSIKDEDNSVDDEKEVTDHHDVKDVKEIKESDLSEIPPSKKEPVVTDEKGKENKRTSDPLNTKENKNDSREISASPPPEKGGPASSPQTTEQTVNKHSAEGPPAAVTKASTGKSKEAEAETSSQANKKFSGSGDGTSSSVMYLICFSIVLLLIAVVIAYVLGFTKSSKGGGDSLDELGEAPPPLVTAAGKLSFQR